MTDPTTVPAVDELERLDELAHRFEEGAHDVRGMADRIRGLRAARAEGRPWHDMAEAPRSTALDLIDRAVGRLTGAGAAFRRMLVHGLRREGATVHGIAQRLGVSHQRVSVLLRDGTGGRRADAPDWSGADRPTSR